jgi:hypothetical protein
MFTVTVVVTVVVPEMPVTMRGKEPTAVAPVVLMARTEVPVPPAVSVVEVGVMVQVMPLMGVQVRPTVPAKRPTEAAVMVSLSGVPDAMLYDAVVGVRVKVLPGEMILMVAVSVSAGVVETPVTVTT